ncbi:DNA glycosylase [Trichocladium antarcticum]|uniref:DNA glycosylase n=1 Tax=Trichocladium antarcticum TaxID=1450529 RepID=A0AAN6ZCL8_9PEZI|nr:DNA glycosylase [Trichocladium antarcticum]
MQTRGVMRKLAEVAATTGTSSTPRTVAEALETSETQASSDTPKPAVDGDEHRSEVTDSLKRKRGKKKSAQPLKGGWVLPHGMGVGVAGPDASDTQGAGPQPLVSSLPVPSLIAAGTTQGGLSATSMESNSKIDAPKQKRQTRISLRVTKAGLDVPKDGQKKQESIMKLEAPDDSTSPPIKQEDDRPTKRTRTSLLTTETASDTKTADKSALEVAFVKIEEKHTTSEPRRKLLIIKGIIIKDNTAVKALDKIIVDAAQLLDPNFRRMVKRGKENPYGLTPGFSPYLYRQVPKPEACEEVHKILTELHGEVKQPEKMPVASLEIAGCGEVPCVLDALLRTLISGNTLMALADAAVKSLAQHYGTQQEGAGAGSINWDKVRLSTHQELVQVIKVAGNGPKRSNHIKQILDMVYAENLARAAATDQSQDVTETGKTTQDLLSLDYMHGMSKDEAMSKFVTYPGIGIKTAACVTLFCLRMPCFAVDTHVHKFCRWLGWVPEKADPDNCFRHGDFMVPDHLKYGLHQLFIRHGQLCFKCRKATKPGTKEWDKADDCPLEHLLARSKDEVAPKPKKERKKAANKDISSKGEDSESEVDKDDGEED